MLRKFALVTAGLSALCGNLLLALSLRLTNWTRRSRLVRAGTGRGLYQTRFGDRFWLNEGSYLDACIIREGVFEPLSTRVVQSLVKPGDLVLDVGANIGYYSVLLSRLAGCDGRVICFEPTDHYRQVLLRNLAENGCGNVTVLKTGLSDRQEDLEIFIGESSASLYRFEGSEPGPRETIHLETLDSVVDELALDRIDFIKIDVDGHEPRFLAGAWKTLDRFDPVVLLEISHQHYVKAGTGAGEFYRMLKGKGYRIYHEQGLAEIGSEDEFLVKCGNFSYSSNIVISRRAPVGPLKG